VPHAAPLLRDAPPRERHRHPHAPRATRPRRRVHHDDLHLRPEPRPRGCAIPRKARGSVPRCRRGSGHSFRHKPMGEECGNGTRTRVRGASDRGVLGLCPSPWDFGSSEESVGA
jgi:hypothetical protein